jgi:hypothetical protein
MAISRAAMLLILAAVSALSAPMDPEPTSWSLTVLGLAAAAFGLYRRFVET